MEKSFAPITMVARFPNVLVVHPSLGVKTIQELIDKAKAEPGKIDFATSGVGSTSHLCILAVHGDGGHRDESHSLQGHQPVAAGRHHRPRPGDDRQSRADPAAHPIRRADCDRRLDRRAGGAAAGRAADRLGGEGLPGELVERAVGAGQDAARDRRQAQRRGQRDPEEARRDREIPRRRLRAGRRHAGRRRKILCRGARPLEARGRDGQAPKRCEAHRLEYKAKPQTPCRCTPCRRQTSGRRTSAPARSCRQRHTSLRARDSRPHCRRW